MGETQLDHQDQRVICASRYDITVIPACLLCAEDGINDVSISMSTVRDPITNVIVIQGDDGLISFGVTVSARVRLYPIKTLAEWF